MQVEYIAVAVAVVGIAIWQARRGTTNAAKAIATWASAEQLELLQKTPFTPPVEHEAPPRLGYHVRVRTKDGTERRADIIVLITGLSLQATLVIRWADDATS